MSRSGHYRKSYKLCNCLGSCPDFSVLPQRNGAGFCSPRGLGSSKRARIVANWLSAVIHQLFAAPGVDTCDYQLAAKFAPSTETRQNLL